MNQREYRDTIFTNHALERLEQRRISQEMVVNTIHQPDRQVKEADGDTQFIKTISGREVHVIAYHKPDEDKWLIKSTWVRGEEDVEQGRSKLLNAVLAIFKALFKIFSRRRRF